MQEKSFLSSINAIVYFAGHEVGHLQNLRIRENYNLQRIRSFWRTDVLTFVPGTSDFQATASKAYVEYESILGSIQDIVKTIDSVRQFSSALGNASNSAALNSTVFNQTSWGVLSSFLGSCSTQPSWGGTMNGAVIPSPLMDLFNRTLSGVASIAEIFSNMTFDIRVKNPVINSSGILSQDDLWVLKGCQLSSREIEISIGNVVIMENVTIMATANYDGSVPSVANGTVPFN